MKNKNKGIYIHIPFCAKKCNYCDFLSFPAGADAKKDYIEALVRELQLYAEINGKPEADSVYIGGGTPSVLEPGLANDAEQQAAEAPEAKAAEAGDSITE